MIGTQSSLVGILCALTGCTALADELVRHRGRCQSLTILDRPASRGCVDEMIVQAGSAAGERAFAFWNDDGTVVLFVGADRQADAAGERVTALSRVDLGLRNGEVEALPATGVCRSVDPEATWRAETRCEAETAKGGFAAQFVTIDGAATKVR